MKHFSDLRIIVFSVIAAIFLLTNCQKDQKPLLNSIKISPDSIELKKGESKKLELITDPMDFSVNVIWKSSASNIATVDKNGNVTANNIGETIITAYADKFTAECLIKVVETTIERIELSKTEIQLLKGSKETITAKIYPENASSQDLVWSSDDKTIASVENGSIIGINIGETRINASIGNIKESCLVKVIGVPVEDIKLNNTSLSLNIGDTYTLKATIEPNNAETRSVKWESEDNSIATVDDNGLVTAIGPGNTKIVVSADDVTVECNVLVSKNIDAKIGYFYYSDGTYSEELDLEKEPIGIIFWLGDPTIHDSTLRKEHPECTNGLVVSLDGEDFSAWQTNYSEFNKSIGDWMTENNLDYISVTTGKGQDDNINKILGYNNTKVLEAFNNDPSNINWKIDAIEKIIEYRNNVLTPESTSGWYLPSEKEISLLCSGELNKGVFQITGNEYAVRDIINSKLKQIENSIELKGYAYWSSQEQDKDNAYNISMGCGWADYYAKDFDKYRIRPVFAF